MADINSRLVSDEVFRSDLKSSTERYLSARDAILVLEARDHPGGGPERVKCLHAHVAHQLISGDNPIGRYVMDVLKWSEPTEPCV